MSGGRLLLRRVVALGGALDGPSGTERNESRRAAPALASPSAVRLGSPEALSFTLWYTPLRLPGCDRRALIAAGGGVGLVGVACVSPSPAFLPGDANEIDVDATVEPRSTSGVGILRV